MKEEEKMEKLAAKYHAAKGIVAQNSLRQF